MEFVKLYRKLDWNELWLNCYGDENPRMPYQPLAEMCYSTVVEGPQATEMYTYGKPITIMAIEKRELRVSLHNQLCQQYCEYCWCSKNKLKVPL